MKKPKPCKKEGCEKKRYNTRTLCYSHILEKERIKKKERLEKAKLRKQSTKKWQKNERKKWHAKCWKLMSKKVRQKGMDDFGTVRCFTCGVPKHWSDLHAGHFQHGKLDFDEKNLRPQCAACNTYRNGMLDVYTMKLIQENSLEWVEQLIADAWQHPGYSLEELKVIYKELL